MDILIHQAASRLVTLEGELTVLLHDGAQTTAAERQDVGDHAAINSVLLTDVATDLDGAAERAEGGQQEVHDVALMALNHGLLVGNLACAAQPGDDAQLEVRKALEQVSVPRSRHGVV